MGQSSITTYVSRLVHATEDFVDDLLYRAEDFECDMRYSLANAFECYDEDDSYAVEKATTKARSVTRGKPRHSNRSNTSEGELWQREIRRLRAELAVLAEEIKKLATTPEEPKELSKA